MYNREIRALERQDAVGIAAVIKGYGWRTVPNGRVAHLWTSYNQPLCSNTTAPQGGRDTTRSVIHCQACKDKHALLQIAVLTNGDDGTVIAIDEAQRLELEEKQ